MKVRRRVFLASSSTTFYWVNRKIMIMLIWAKPLRRDLPIVLFR